jgi:hypothetical protein
MLLMRHSQVQELANARDDELLGAIEVDIPATQIVTSSFVHADGGWPASTFRAQPPMCMLSCELPHDASLDDIDLVSFSRSTLQHYHDLECLNV